ncbi:serine acetyltransferase [Microbulbifer marinus]|nr:hypothetical protein [Microbulbifer marinus]
MHHQLSVKYSIKIPKETEVGAGLYLGHASSIIIHPTAKIGKNCNLSQFTTIGSNHGKAATIGDNVYIGPNVCIVENVIVDDSAIIGAGAVVVKNISRGYTAVGNPARQFPTKFSACYIQNPV